MKVLVTGATGYIGGRLIPKLLQKGIKVRVLVRDASRIEGRSWENKVEICVGDLLNLDSLAPALKDIDAAYYLVHSMYGGKNYAERDRLAANNFVQAGRYLKQVIYLGGLLPDTKEVSNHLKSRSEVGEILRKGLPTLEFRAGPIIGSGSASFEMVRYLTERLPVMVAPKWIHHKVQPIAIRDVMRYLIQAVEKRCVGVIDIGADILTFKQMMDGYAKTRGLTRTIITVPVLAPRLAAIWVGLVTPISNSLAVPLIEGVIHPIVGDTTRAEDAFPEIRPLPYIEAVESALDFWRVEEVERPKLLRLRAEMKVPGRAWLEWQTMPEGNGTRLVQTALFEPSGLWGVLYWQALYPIHRFIFDDMIRAIAKDSSVLVQMKLRQENSQRQKIQQKS